MKIEIIGKKSEKNLMIFNQMESRNIFFCMEFQIPIDDDDGDEYQVLFINSGLYGDCLLIPVVVVVIIWPLL
mgnify:CR=1 FL=1